MRKEGWCVMEHCCLRLWSADSLHDTSNNKDAFKYIRRGMKIMPWRDLTAKHLEWIYLILDYPCVCNPLAVITSLISLVFIILCYSSQNFQWVFLWSSLFFTKTVDQNPNKLILTIFNVIMILRCAYDRLWSTSTGLDKRSRSIDHKIDS